MGPCGALLLNAVLATYLTVSHKEQIGELYPQVPDCGCGGITIYKDTELKTYPEQAGFYEVQIHKKKSWLCVTARK